MITSIVFDVDDTIYDRGRHLYRIAMEKCFRRATWIKSFSIRFRHILTLVFHVMAVVRTTEYFRLAL